jgi:hypothetical protein
MGSLRLFACAAALAISSMLAAPLSAQTDDVFDFIPVGGKTLLTKVFESRPSADEVRTLLSAKRTREEWLSHLKESSKAIPALQKLSEKELLTLADYLSFNMPLPAAQVPADPAKADWGKLLPRDARDFALDRCQGCHIITVVVTQSRSKDAWLGTMNKPSHVQIKISREQREALASYLVINAGIPIDLVPEELRAGGATY